jgi:hypothetical protein
MRTDGQTLGVRQTALSDAGMKIKYLLKRNQRRKGNSVKAQLLLRPPVTSFETNFAEAVTTWASAQTAGAARSGCGHYGISCC